MIIETPYDRPRALIDRILWPMLRRAWLLGYDAGMRSMTIVEARRTGIHPSRTPEEDRNG